MRKISVPPNPTDRPWRSSKAPVVRLGYHVAKGITDITSLSKSTLNSDVHSVHIRQRALRAVHFATSNARPPVRALDGADQGLSADAVGAVGAPQGTDQRTPANALPPVIRLRGAYLPAAGSGNGALRVHAVQLHGCAALALGRRAHAVVLAPAEGRAVADVAGAVLVSAGATAAAAPAALREGGKRREERGARDGAEECLELLLLQEAAERHQAGYQHRDADFDVGPEGHEGVGGCKQAR